MKVDLILPTNFGLLILFSTESTSAGEKFVGRFLTASMKLKTLILLSEADEEGVILISGLGSNPMT